MIIIGGNLVKLLWMKSDLNIPGISEFASAAGRANTSLKWKDVTRITSDCRRRVIGLPIRCRSMRLERFEVVSESLRACPAALLSRYLSHM